MGFTADQARDSLIQTGNNLEQATEYILTNPPPASSAARVSLAKADIKTYNINYLNEPNEQADQQHLKKRH